MQHMQCKAGQKQCVLKTWEMTLRLEVVSQVFRVTIGHGGDVIHITLDNRHASSSSLPPPPPLWSPGQSQRGLSSPPISYTGLQTYTYTLYIIQVSKHIDIHYAGLQTQYFNYRPANIGER